MARSLTLQHAGPLPRLVNGTDLAPHGNFRVALVLGCSSGCSQAAVADGPRIGGRLVRRLWEDYSLAEIDARRGQGKLFYLAVLLGLCLRLATHPALQSTGWSLRLTLVCLLAAGLLFFSGRRWRATGRNRRGRT